MKKQQTAVPQRVLKNLELFRARQRKSTTIPDETLSKIRQYHELEQILSPFWAWRSKSI